MLKERVLRGLRTDETGVSPVIGVSLMVAVTVIIAAVIGSTALSMGDSVSKSPPQVQFETETDTETISDGDGYEITVKSFKLEHNGGEDVDVRNLKVTIDGRQAYDHRLPENHLYPTVDGEGSEYAQPIYPFDQYKEDLVSGEDNKISSGDSAELYSATNDIESENIDFSKEQNQVMYTFDDRDPVRFLHDGWQNPDRFENQEESAHLESGQTVRVVWEPSGSDQSQTLYEGEIA